MPIDQNAVAAYAAELADAAGIPADQRPAFLSNEKVLATARKRFEDVERETGRVRAEKERADKATAESQRIYEENLKIFNANKQAVDAAQAKVDAYVREYGELPGGGNPNNPTARAAAVENALDKKTFDEEMKKRDGFTVSLIKDAATIAAKHLKTFNEEPDFDAIEQIAIKEGVSAKKAYEMWAAPKFEERSKVANEAALKAAREEGFRDGQSKIAAGAVADSKDSSPFLANLRKAGEVKTGPKESFLSGWREAGKTQ